MGSFLIITLKDFISLVTIILWECSTRAAFTIVIDPFDYSLLGSSSLYGHLAQSSMCQQVMYSVKELLIIKLVG